MAKRRFRKSRNLKGSLRLILLLLVVGLIGGAFFLFFEGHKPEIDITKVPDYLGKQDTLKIDVNDRGSGLKEVLVTATQGEKVAKLYAVQNPRTTYTGQIGPPADTLSLDFSAAKHGFTDGEVEIAVEARDFSLRGMLAGNQTIVTKTLTLDTKPPGILLLHSEKYISPGGTGIAIYQVSEDATEQHGAIINGKFSRGFPLGDGRKNTYIVYFALTYDTDSVEESKLTAVDVAGNAAAFPFQMVLKPAKQKKDRINVSDGFLNPKIPEFEQYYPDMEGSNLVKYLQLNGKIRHENNARIAELCGAPADKRMWQGNFVRMSGSSHAGFADHRTYFYNGKAVDNQVHLGVDIASTERVAVKVANSGKIVFADYLGIYGNMVLVDHGQGIFSLYSHLSQISSTVGDMVATGDKIGNTGTTGMAGGDHLHFSMLIHGVFVTPVEWWDPHWIEVTIEEPIDSSKF